MLMGRRTYEVFAPSWPVDTGEYADRMNTIRKYVFSSTLDMAEWNNSVIIRGRGRDSHLPTRVNLSMVVRV
jgi:dihydrofolate reductase